MLIDNYFDYKYYTNLFYKTLDTADEYELSSLYYSIFAIFEKLSYKYYCLKDDKFKSYVDIVVYDAAGYGSTVLSSISNYFFYIREKKDANLIDVTKHKIASSFKQFCLLVTALSLVIIILTKRD